MENTHNDNTLEITRYENEFRCVLCNRNLCTNRWLTQHLNTCRRKQADNVLQHFLNGPIKEIHPIVFDVIDEEMVLRAASISKGGSGPSGLDADGWKRMLTSNSFGTDSSDLRKLVGNFIEKICSQRINSENKSLEAFIASRFIPLNINPGLRPIGVGEVLRRIAGKAVMNILKEDVMHAAGSLQVCAGQEAGAEAAIRAMYDIYNDEDSEGVLLVDAENAFNSINRNVMLYNISVLCPIILTYGGCSSDSASSYFSVQVKSRSMLHHGSVRVSSE